MERSVRLLSNAAITVRSRLELLIFLCFIQVRENQKGLEAGSSLLFLNCGSFHVSFFHLFEFGSWEEGKYRNCLVCFSLSLSREWVLFVLNCLFLLLLSVFVFVPKRPRTWPLWFNSSVSSPVKNFFSPECNRPFLHSSEQSVIQVKPPFSK